MIAHANSHSKSEDDSHNVVTVLRATADDSRNIWEWRNDGVTKSMSITTNSVSWDAHSSWYEKSLANKNRYLYVGYLNGAEKIGMCRFDIDSNAHSAEVSINLNPLYRNKKLSMKLLAVAINEFSREASLPLRATIKKMNVVSIKCFTSIGFKFERDDGEYNYYHYQL